MLALWTIECSHSRQRVGECHLAHYILAGLVVVLLNGAASHAAEVVDSKTLQERHDKIVKMSQVERDRLQRNLAEFQKLDPEKQKQYRDLTADLEENHSKGGQLSSLMQTYATWLQTLTPGQREALRQKTDSAEKLRLVQKFKEEQVRESFNSIVLPTPNEPWKQRPFQPALIVPELNSIMRVLVEDLPEEDRKEIGRVNRVDQHPDILRRSIQHADNPHEWPSEELQEKIQRELPGRFRTYFRNNPRREMLVKLIFSSIGAHMWEEQRHKWPTENEVEQVYSALDSRMQASLDQLSPDERREKLMKRFFEQHPERAPRRLDEVHRMMKGLMEQIGIDASAPIRPFQGDGPPPFRPGPEGRFAPGDREPRQQGRDGGRGEPLRREERRDDRNGNRKGPE